MVNQTLQPRIALAGLRLVILAVGTGLCEDIIKIGAISSFYIPFLHQLLVVIVAYLRSSYLKNLSPSYVLLVLPSSNAALFRPQRLIFERCYHCACRLSRFPLLWLQSSCCRRPAHTAIVRPYVPETGYHQHSGSSTAFKFECPGSVCLLYYTRMCIKPYTILTLFSL